MNALLAICGLTWKAALRFRLFLVVALLLLASVVGLPLLLRDDGTARGFTQILITYTLSTITGLLGFSTLWLACGTLARDIEECQMQVVAVKPVARWQIWLGKWLGIVSLNAVLLALSGASVYGLLLWRAGHLPADQRETLRREVLVARGSIKPRDLEPEIQADTDKLLQERLSKSPITDANMAEVRRQIYEEVKAGYQVVPGQAMRQWVIPVGLLRHLIGDQPIQLRFKFYAADRSPSGTFTGYWMVGEPGKEPFKRFEPLSLAPDTFHEIEIPANMIDADGNLRIAYANPNDTSLLFPLDDGIEVLYREGGFGLNFARGLGIVCCWMALLAAIGLASASLLSFPVAAFVSLAILIMALSSSTMSNVVSEGSIMSVNSETGVRTHSPVDWIIVPTFSGALQVINLVRGFSPVDLLSSGRSVSWAELGRAFAQIVLLIGGVFGAAGIFIFNRRELATAQGNN